MARTPILEDWERQKLDDMRNGLTLGYSKEDQLKFLAETLWRVIAGDLERRADERKIEHET